MTKQKATATQRDNEDDSSQSFSHDNNSSRSASSATLTAGPTALDDSGTKTDQSRLGKNRVQRTKKERSDNWATIEIQTLQRGVERRRSTFYGPPDQSTKKNREEAWKHITREINAVSQCNRTVAQTIKKYKNEKQRNRSKKSTCAFNSTPGHQTPIDQLLSSNIVNDNNGSNASPATSRVEFHQQHHQASFNVVKFTPTSTQSAAKSMIDLPNHMHQLPSDDLLLLVPEMDGLLNGMNIVSDALNSQPQQHGQNTIQAINTSPATINGPRGNSLITRTMPNASMCSFIYSAGNELFHSEYHPSSNVESSYNNLASSQSVSGQRNTSDLNTSQTHYSTNQQDKQDHSQVHQQHQDHNQQAHQSTQFLPTTSPTNNASTISAQLGSLPIESQMKNVLFNVLLNKEAPSTTPNLGCSSPDSNKHRNDMLTIIAGSLNKIENHLSKISKVATTLVNTVKQQHSNVNLGHNLHLESMSNNIGKS